jgi:hypothetical protein
MSSKVCTTCNVSKELSDFWNHKNGKHGKASKCIECLKADDNRKAYNNAYNKKRWQDFKKSPEFNQVTEQQKFFRRNRIQSYIDMGKYDKAIQLAVDYNMDVEAVKENIDMREQHMKQFQN